MKKLEKKHPLAIRWYHWVNIPLLLLMLWSGLLIYWANDVYRLRLGSRTVFRFFPDRFFDALGIPYHLAEGMSIHFFIMWLFVLNGVLYVGYTLVSGEWRLLVPDRHSFREAVLVTLHDLGLRKTEPPPRKFNGAQQIAYTGVILMGAASLVTGLAIYKPVQLAWLTSALGGYPRTRAIHFTLAVGYVLFFVVHMLQVARTGWNNFRSMVTGYEIVAVAAPAGEQPASPRPVDGARP